MSASFYTRSSFSFLPLHLFSSLASLLLSVDGIVSYFKKQAGPASVELKDEEHLQKFISDADASVVGEPPFEFSVIDFCVYGQCNFSVMYE